MLALGREYLMALTNEVSPVNAPSHSADLSSTRAKGTAPRAQNPSAGRIGNAAVKLLDALVSRAQSRQIFEARTQSKGQLIGRGSSQDALLLGNG